MKIYKTENSDAVLVSDGEDILLFENGSYGEGFDFKRFTEVKK